MTVATDLHVWDIAGDSLGSNAIVNYISNAHVNHIKSLSHLY